MLPCRCKLSIGFSIAGSPEDVIHAHAVEVCQSAQNLRWNHSLSAFIIGVGALRHVDCLANLLLCEVCVFTQASNSFISLHFITIPCSV